MGMRLRPAVTDGGCTSGRGFAMISSSLIFALRKREIHLRFFGSKKAPVAISPRFLSVSSHFL